MAITQLQRQTDEQKENKTIISIITEQDITEMTMFISNKQDVKKKKKENWHSFMSCIDDDDDDDDRYFYFY